MWEFSFPLLLSFTFCTYIYIYIYIYIIYIFCKLVKSIVKPWTLNLPSVSRCFEPVMMHSSRSFFTYYIEHPQTASVQVVYLKFPTIIPFSGCAYVTNSMSPAMGNNFLSNTRILSEMSKYLLENIFNSNLMQPLQWGCILTFIDNNNDFITREDKGDREGISYTHPIP